MGGKKKGKGMGREGRERKRGSGHPRFLLGVMPMTGAMLSVNQITGNKYDMIRYDNDIFICALKS